MAAVEAAVAAEAAAAAAVPTHRIANVTKEGTVALTVSFGEEVDEAEQAYLRTNYLVEAMAASARAAVERESAWEKALFVADLASAEAATTAASEAQAAALVEALELHDAQAVADEEAAREAAARARAVAKAARQALAAARTELQAAQQASGVAARAAARAETTARQAHVPAKVRDTTLSLGARALCVFEHFY